MPIFTLRACARGKAIGFVCCLSVVCLFAVIMKITRSLHLGIWVTRKYNVTVEIIEKLASLYFKSLGKAHECHKNRAFIGHTYQLQGHVLSAYAHNSLMF